MSGVLRRRGAVPVVVAGVLLLAGCSAVGPSGAAPSGAAASGGTRPAASVPAASAPAADDPDCGDPRASYAPDAAADGPGPAAIRRRGELVVGTSADLLGWAAWDARAQRFAGVEADLARELARDLLGDPDKVGFRAIAFADRERLLADGSVDVVVMSMTMTCARWSRVEFSSAYHEASKRLLVRTDLPADVAARGLAGMTGRPVCAPAGSTSLDRLQQQPQVRAVTAPDAGQCLVRLQEGDVDGIVGDDVTLAGFAAQDPGTRIAGPELSAEPYGVAVRKGDVALAQRVNAVLQRLRSDGTLTRLVTRFEAATGEDLGPEAPPAAVTGRAAS